MAHENFFRYFFEIADGDLHFRIQDKICNICSILNIYIYIMRYLYLCVLNIYLLFYYR